MGACPFHHFPKKYAVMTARLNFLAANLTEFLWKQSNAQTQGSHSLFMALMPQHRAAISLQCPKNHNTLAEPLRRIQSGSKPAPGKRESPSVEQVNGKRKAHQKRRELCHGYIPTELSLQLRKQTFPSPPSRPKFLCGPW